MDALVVALAYAYLAVIAAVLAVVDLRTHRLPNRIVLPAYPVFAGLLALACVLGTPWGAFGRAVVGGAVLFVFYAILRALPGRGMGGGDVKLAGLLGMALAFLGWSALALGALAGFMLGGIAGVVVLLRRRTNRHTRIPFGPWMIAGGVVGLLLG